MTTFLSEINEDEYDEVFLANPTFCEKVFEYKQTFFEAIILIKVWLQHLEDYVVPESVVLDRLGHKPKGRVVQMRLYSLSKRHFALVFAAFISCFLLTTLGGIAGPAIISTTAVNLSYLDPTMNIHSMATGPFTFFSPVLNTFNQQIWLLARIRIKNPSSATYMEKFQVRVTMFAIGEDGSGISGVTNHTHERKLICHGQELCEPIVVLHLGYLAYSKFRVKVEFFDLEDTNNQGLVKDVLFDFKTYNPTFTQVEIWFRFVFLVLTFLVTCWFAHMLRRYHVRNWTIEQKWLSLLLPLLLLYDDPIFPLSFLINSWVPGMLDALFQATFLCTLLLFWLCVYHGIRTGTERRPFLKFYLPKLIICGLLWLAAITLGSWQQYNELVDPTYQYRVDMKNFLGMKIFFFLMGGVYLLYLGFLLIRGCSELHLKPYANLRLKFLTALTVCVVVVSIVIVALRFGANILENNFVAEISTKYGNSAEFVCFYGLLNFYTYTMAFVYSPSENALTDPVFRADTGFSLLNDSDEDILYGSDAEEVPLRNGNVQRYDSD